MDCVLPSSRFAFVDRGKRICCFSYFKQLDSNRDIMSKHLLIMLWTPYIVE